MKKQKIILDKLSLVGITARTNNKNEFNPETAKIGNLTAAYWRANTSNSFKGRVNPGVTYAVYTDFESDEHGDYTFFIGEEVDPSERQDAEFTSLSIPASTYQKFTTPSGKMPDVVITSWQKIWAMKPQDFGGKRLYIADFEVYDQRAVDPTNTIIDIYIGIDDQSA